MLPVSRERRFMASTWSIDGRLITHSPVRMMFLAVCETASKPNMQRHPSQKADEMGARLYEPSSLRELLRITGVPRYKMAGSILLCVADKIKLLTLGEEARCPSLNGT